MPSRVLIIGADGKYRDSDVYSWRRAENEQPLVGDYDDVIIYMPSIRSEAFEVPARALGLFALLRKGVADALQGAIRIHFVASPPTRFSNASSYTLMPFDIDHDVEAGKNFKHKATDAFPYIERVTGWQVAFKDNPHQFGVSHVLHAFESLARTNHEKNAAFRITFRHENTAAPKGTINVLPPVMEGGSPSEEKTLNELLNYFVPLDDVDVRLPERYQSITLPGEETLRNEDAELEKVILNATTRRDAISADLGEYEQLKGIVAFKGKPLEKCVDAVLKKLGIDYVPTETNKEDGSLALATDLRIPVEVKGHETKGSSEKDLRQVIARLKDETAGQPVRGLLIVNPFYTLPDAEQAGKKTFESSVVEQAKAFHIALLDTRVLLKYVADHLKHGNSQLLEILKETSGEVLHRKPPAGKPE